MWSLTGHVPNVFHCALMMSGCACISANLYVSPVGQMSELCARVGGTQDQL